MIFLIETAGEKTEMYFTLDIESAKRELRSRFLKVVREAENFDWRYTFCTDDCSYAKVKNGKEVTEWRLCEIDNMVLRNMLDYDNMNNKVKMGISA